MRSGAIEAPATPEAGALGFLTGIFRSSEGGLLHGGGEEIGAVTTPSLVLCSKACCAESGPCGDAGWAP